MECSRVGLNSATFKAVSLRSTPLIRHAPHDTFPRKGGRISAPHAAAACPTGFFRISQTIAEATRHMAPAAKKAGR
jgi:hypothetical protein